MGWPDLEPTKPHLSYLLLSLFLIAYALFSELIRNRVHLSEPPLATIWGILCGPRVADVLNPEIWGWTDNITQELTRVIVGLQVFVVGIELPRRWLKRHWKSVLVLLGPVMSFGWLVSAVIIYFVLQVEFTTALIIGACLTPTDPVLSASVLGEARFSQRVPKRLRHLLAAESGCNDGISFPFLYAGLLAVLKASAAPAVKDWFLDVIVWQCLVGTLIGIVIGKAANELLKMSEKRGFIMDFTLFVFYLLMAVLCVGVGSTLGSDDFLVCFGAGAAFAWDGWFSDKISKVSLPNVIDLLLNSAFFVYFGSIIPWASFHDHLSPGRLVGCLALILLFRRIPIIMALHRWIPDVRNISEALFAGHFGPMGVGGLFLAIEARAQLETESSIPLPYPSDAPAFSKGRQQPIDDVWPVICFVVLGSIMVHGTSAFFMSLYSHFTRPKGERHSLLGGETERLYGMVSGEEVEDLDSEDSDS